MTGLSRAARILAGTFAISSVICAPLSALALGNDAPAADLALEADQPDTLTYLYEVEGIQVIHRRMLTNDVVAVNLYLLGGARQVTERTAGIEPVLLRASERGTRNYPGTATLEAQARTGSRMVVSAGLDWTIFGFRSLVEEFDSTWAVFADRLMYPTLDSAAVEMTRERMVNSARSAPDDPEFVVWSLAESVAYSGHPYAVPVSGTEQSLAVITIEDLRAYLNEQIVTSRMLLVVVGNVSRERVEAVVRGTIGQLPRGNYVWELPPTWKADRPSVEVRQRDLPTNYIVGYFSGPDASSDDYPAFRIATALLGGVTFSDLRNEGLSYSAGARFIESGAAGGAVYVLTTEPTESMEIVNEAIDWLNDPFIPWEVWTDYAEGWIISYYFENETNAEQADFLARAYLYQGELRTPKECVDELRGVSPTEVGRAARHYLKNIQYVYLGDITAAPRDLMTKH